MLTEISRVSCVLTAFSERVPSRELLLVLVAEGWPDSVDWDELAFPPSDDSVEALSS